MLIWIARYRIRQRRRRRHWSLLRAGDWLPALPQPRDWRTDRPVEAGKGGTAYSARENVVIAAPDISGGSSRGIGVWSDRDIKDSHHARPQARRLKAFGNHAIRCIRSDEGARSRRDHRLSQKPEIGPPALTPLQSREREAGEK